ncbi:MAG: ATP-binding cassette domain-containing protein, partial [Planctomycetota bacterium]
MRVRIEDLTFRYPQGGFRLDVPALDLASGSLTAVIGPSGSGKTTLLHLVAGIAEPERGHVRLDDTDLTSLDDAARRAFRVTRLGAVFQEFELLEYLDVR